MENTKKWRHISTDVIKKNGLYVHYSLPRVLGVISSEQLRKWALSGAEARLERAVLAGHGRRILDEADTIPLSRHLYNLIAKCDALHAAVEKGSLLELQELLESDYNHNKYVGCYDEAGVGLLHKAVFYNYFDIVEWLVTNYPRLVHLRDSEGRTPLHYTAACREKAAEAAAAALLESAGAARGARDAAGRTAAHYRAARTSLALPDAAAMPARPSAPGLAIKRHNIRIWCHECDMGRLQRVVWEGHGSRLLSEVSNQPVVKKFLEAVPYLMNTIRDMHNAVIQNDLEGFIKLTAEPVSPQVFSSRDVNNMTVLHKAAGLGHGSILKYIVERYPQGINDVDNDGRTPLHYAATVKDEQHTYNTLVGFGADESLVDNKNKTPGYYINRSQEIDKNILKTVPDAPRTPSSVYPSSWDWKILSADFIAEFNKKSRKKNLKASNENISSKKTNNTLSESLENQTGAMKGSSTHELISNLPELDDSDKAHAEKTNDKNVNESEVHQETIEENKHDVHEQEENDEPNDEKRNTTPIEIDDNIKNTETADEEQNIEEKSDLVPSSSDAVEKITPESITEHENQAEISQNEADEVEDNNKETELHAEPEKDSKEDDENNKEKPKTDEQHAVQEVDETTESNISANETHNPTKENKIDFKCEENDQTLEKHEIVQERYHKDNDNDALKENVDESTNQAKHSENVHLHENVRDRDDETETTTDEGNYHRDLNEDDDDVQAQGDYQSDHRDDNDKSNPTADSSISKRGNHNGRNSQESLIEGIISGEAEQDSQDASMNRSAETVQGDLLIVENEIDPEVTELINTTNMEMLATLVLNGEGSRLLGRRSGNSELQAFLDNVPIYMQKIKKVHLAAKEGNIKDLQTALDRRKFAIARDPISPNGATPLHVATVFGKTNIMKYLGGRFPETLSAVDFEGRTALHYAAVLPDNGHYYNLLQQLGANSKDLDDNGRSAEDYYKNPTLLPFNQLLTDFGISEEEARTMLSDKGLSHADNGHMDIPIFHTEEGRYLAKSLGDPLIKGLTEVAHVKPKDPIAFLASFLHNFPDQEKPRLGTQESNTLITEEAPEVENEQPPPAPDEAPIQSVHLTRSAARTATRPQRPIDVITVDPQAINPDGPEAAFSSINRDEHGQSMLHFAAARSHTNNALFQLLQESDVSLGYRDELYRTARDVSIQANVPENTIEIDKWMLHLAARGETDKIMELLLQGYDHILDVVDEEGVPITEVIAKRGDSEISNLLASIPAFEESRESLHGAIRRGDLAAVREAVTAEGGRTLACAQNAFGRTSLHVAVLAEYEDIVEYLAETCPELLRIGDNLERTPLHYAMGVDKIESLSRILIRTGAKRVLKDLKGRQPSYYFMNKSDILRLKEEESIY